MRLGEGDWVFNKDLLKFLHAMKTMVDEGKDVRKAECPKCLGKQVPKRGKP